MTDDENRPPLVLLHGLTFDRRQWDPARRELAVLDPARQILTPDLPGHGESPRRASYTMAEVAEAVHDQVTAAGFAQPVVVGHSVGAVVATTYAARYPVRGVVNLDQILLPGPFGAVVRQAEPALRGPDWRRVWDGLVAGMGIEALPAEAREIVTTATEPRPDLLLGYWGEILSETDEDIADERYRALRAIGERNIPYRWVTSSEPPPRYLAWLRDALPEVVVTVLPGGHFPHLAEPATIARLLAVS
ncbi:alpha/beta hydrolase [Micromonospora sp. STR1_7]|uniref:Alpha/beta hydrolase n=1 Tax=Micromonospora parastrephiae TaxID=2806101 RepID=A0ABS1XYF9_9ACTN|nr:alpha/beta hydrolase [Micromonospora parastrephiae]MBM0234275.1 alpha/beta hydrolase [Micromonospora parastrephiae]